MDKYQAFSILNLCQLIYILALIFISAVFNNYWLLFLLLLSGIDSSEKRLLGLKEKTQ